MTPEFEIERKMEFISNHESEVRSYSRAYPVIFHRSKGEFLYTEAGNSYLDFFSGAGSLNYGHNPDVIKQVVIEYLSQDGIAHGLDMFTSAKHEFVSAFVEHVLKPRDLDYRIQFCSPSGTNAVEAAIKLARLVTGRNTIVAFSGAFHGVSSGSLAAAGSHYYKRGLYSSLGGVYSMPYPVSPLGNFDSLGLLRHLIQDPSSGTQKPAAILLESIQAEGGIYPAPDRFLRDLRALCDEHQILLIVDDIQMGCGRTGSFFSFEGSGIKPDLVALAKSIGGYGFPLALLLIDPRWDRWQPGQHNGTFRGNQIAFVAGAAAIRLFWDPSKTDFPAQISERARFVETQMLNFMARFPSVAIRGRGLIWGIDLSKCLGPTSAAKISQLCFAKGLVIESCGRNDEVLKIIPPLNIEMKNLQAGIQIILEVIENELASF